MAKLKLSRLKGDPAFADPDRGPVVSVRFGIALLLIVAGIAWIVYYYTGVRAPTDDSGFATGDATGPKAVRDLGQWNYLIGFGAFFLGLIIAAHPSTPLGRGRGVVVGMLGCFLLGLAWICTFYAIAQNPEVLPVFDDLEQKNLIVGIAAMAVGFTFATRWE